MPLIMGIINVTPDSFYDGGLYLDVSKAVKHAKKLYKEGADILDIGAESSKPFAKPVPEHIELARVLPVIKAIREAVPLPISIDTQKTVVAEKAIELGATMVNDISGLSCSSMRALVKNTDVSVCIMHMQNDPEIMQINPHYDNGVIYEICDYLQHRAQQCLEEGIKPDKIILDPGIGFGKTVHHNLDILQNLDAIVNLGFPVLIGASRKSFLSHILNKPAKELLIPTLAANTMALMNGASIIRVHDVKEHRQVVDLFNYMHSHMHQGSVC